MNQYVIVAVLNGEREEFPVFADDIVDALEWAEEEYGEANVRSVRTRIFEQPKESL